MNSKLSHEILKLCPNIFKQDPFHPTPFSERGMEVGDGWFEIVRTMAIKLEALLVSQSIEFRNVRVSQIKEKFGCLRVYLDGNMEGAQEIIRAAEAESRIICENCGLAGKKQKQGGRLMTVCDRHFPDE